MFPNSQTHGCSTKTKKIRRGRMASADFCDAVPDYLPVATTVPYRSTMETLVMEEPGVQ